MLIDGFNEACKNISASYLKVGDDSMSTIIFWKTARGNLPHLSYILRKPEPLVTEFKTVTCYVTGVFIFIEVHTLKEGTKKRKCHQKIGATAACTKRMM